MKKIFTIVLFTMIVESSFSSATLKNGNEKKKFPVLLGLVIKYVAPVLKDAIVNYVMDYIESKYLKVVDSNNLGTEGVEEIIIKIEDKDGDGDNEITTAVEDHDGDGRNDNVITVECDGDNENEILNKLLQNELHYIDQFYEGDIDGDGKD